MRFLILVLGLICSCPALATPVPPPLLSISVKGLYGSRFTTIAKEKDEWVYRTDIAPYHLSPASPFQKSTLERIRSSKERSSRIEGECRETVIGIDRTAGSSRTYQGCTDDPDFVQLLRETDRHCGRT